MPEVLRIATRGSALALWQARWVQAQLEQRGTACELVIVKTQGDRETSAFREMRGQGFFTKAVQEALLEDRADLAVHSLKDLPSANVPGLMVAAIPEREDARELLLVRPEAFDANAPVLPIRANAGIGSSAVRRQAQVQAMRPDLSRLELRGNVTTRIEKLRHGEYDAILLAHAGIKRLGLDLNDLKTLVLEPKVFVPAPGQGALALECREADANTRHLLAQIDDPQARLSTGTERGLMGRLQGGCQLALGAHATLTPDGIRLIAWHQGRLLETEATTPEQAIAALFAEIVFAAG